MKIMKNIKNLKQNGKINSWQFEKKNFKCFVNTFKKNVKFS